MIRHTSEQITLKYYISLNILKYVYFMINKTGLRSESPRNMNKYLL